MAGFARYPKAFEAQTVLGFLVPHGHGTKPRIYPLGPSLAARAGP